MNKSIKNMVLILLAIFSIQKGRSQNANEIPKNLWTIEQVKEMAKKYNLQDSVSMTRNNVLLFMPKEEIEKFLKREYNAIHQRDEFKTFRSKTKNIRNYSDYFALVNSLPYVRNAVVNDFGGEKAFQEHKKYAIANEWRIYRSNSGAVRFIKADTPIAASESKLGQRIDNLPKN